MEGAKNLKNEIRLEFHSNEKNINGTVVHENTCLYSITIHSSFIEDTKKIKMDEDEIDFLKNQKDISSIELNLILQEKQPHNFSNMIRL